MRTPKHVNKTPPHNEAFNILKVAFEVFFLPNLIPI